MWMHNAIMYTITIIFSSNDTIKAPKTMSFSIFMSVTIAVLAAVIVIGGFIRLYCLKKSRFSGIRGKLSKKQRNRNQRHWTSKSHLV